MQVKSFSDFSGGVTDKVIPGPSNRYTSADNLLIDANQKLYTRPGFNILSSTAYTLPAQERVARLINFDFDSELIALQNKKLFYVNAGAWTELQGPAAASIFPTNTASSLIEESQVNHTLYLASNSGDPVAKMFVDDTNTHQLRTAGLPKPPITAIFPDAATKLSIGITLALDIRNSMIDHVDDFGVAPAAHPAQDAANSAALAALATPVTLGDLITYTTSLRTIYDSHVGDAREAAPLQLYHAGISDLGSVSYFYVRNPIINLLTEESQPDNANVTTIEEVIRLLNDIRLKYNLHIYAPITHNNATQTSPSWGDHATTVPPVNLDANYTQAIPNISTLLRYVNNLKEELNFHVSNGLSSGYYSFKHMNVDSNNQIRMADATDTTTCAALLGCIYYHYAQHIETANRYSKYNIGGTAVVPPNVDQGLFYSATKQNIWLFKGDVTAGSPTISNVTPNPVTQGLPTGYFIIKETTDVTDPYENWAAPFNNPASLKFPQNTTTTGNGATTINMNQNSLVTAANIEFAFHWNGVHVDAERNTTANYNSALAAKAYIDLFDYTLSLDALSQQAVLIATAIKAHETGNQTAVTDIDLATGNYGIVGQEIKAGYTYYPITPIFSTGQFAPTHLIVAGQLAQFPSADAIRNPPAPSGFIPNQGQGYFEAGLTVKSYLYRFVFSIDYKVGQVDFTDISAPSEPIQIDSMESPASPTSGDTTWWDYIGLAGLQVLANAANTHYDVTNSKVEIYRTIGDGSVYYKIGEVTNGTTTYLDYTDDTTLLSNEALYTNGGIVGNDSPPVTGIIHALDNRMYYAVGNKVFQSLSNDPDSVPANFFDTFEEDVIGISSTRSNLVVFSNLNVYRVEGEFDELGNGFMRHERIFDRTGCVAQQSIVKADNGLFFAGKDGFYFTDGFQCFRVTDFEDTFVGYTLTDQQKKAITGAYDSVHKKVFWTIETTNFYTNPNLIIVLDLQFGIKKDITPTTTYSGGFDGYTGFNPTALTFFNNYLHYGDGDGYIMFEDISAYVDLVKNTAVAATAWDKRTLLWNYKSCNDDFGSANFRKYFTRVNVEFEQITNLSVQIKSDADKGRIMSDLPIIRSRKLLDWGDPKIDWTSSVYTAKDGGVIDEFRRFHADGSLRSNYRAIELQNAYCVVVASNIMGNLNVTAFAANIWTLTLLGSPTYKWPLYSVGYFVRIGGVDYPVTSRVSDSVVRVSDSGLTPLIAQANIQWEMWGYPKNEAAKLVNLDVNYEIMGQMQKDYQGTTSTDGGQND